MIPLMKIPWDARMRFRERPNRFTAVLENENGDTVLAHIHDPGRLQELLLPGTGMLLRKARGGNRKTGWDVLTAEHGGRQVLINSGLHREIADRLITHPEIEPFGPVRGIRHEVRAGESRLDMLLELSGGEELFVEVKGCTLAVDGTALFPDAPTSRGRRHLETLAELSSRGRRSAVLMLVFRDDALRFSPNSDTDPAFARALRAAMDRGVEFRAHVFTLRDGELFHLRRIPLDL